MAHHTATKKSIRKTVTKTAVNKSRISRVRTFVKKLEALISTGDKASATKLFKTVQSVIMKSVSKGSLTLNTASRTVSRLSAKIKKLA